MSSAPSWARVTIWLWYTKSLAFIAAIYSTQGAIIAEGECGKTRPNSRGKPHDAAVDLHASIPLTLPSACSANSRIAMLATLPPCHPTIGANSRVFAPGVHFQKGASRPKEGDSADDTIPTCEMSHLAGELLPAGTLRRRIPRSRETNRRVLSYLP